MITKFKIFLESVGDTYVDTKYGTEPNFNDFDKKYNMLYNEPKVIYRDNYKKGTLSIIKNPISLNHVGPWTRGVIDSKGDLYMEVEPITIHNRILNILSQKGIIHTYIIDLDNISKKQKEKLSLFKNKESWYWLLWRTEGSSEFLTVQRDANTNTIKIGEMELHHAEKINKQLLNKAKLKNPGINFVNEIIESTPKLPDMGKTGDKYRF